MPKRRKIKKLKKKLSNIFLKYILPISSIIISVIALLSDYAVIEDSTLPKINFTSVDNTLISHKKYITYNGKINSKLTVVNLGQGTAKNIKISWAEENKYYLRKLIEKLDINKEISIEENNSFIMYSSLSSSGEMYSSALTNDFYVDYLLSENDRHSEVLINIPLEYMAYINILFDLVLHNNYDVEKLAELIVLSAKLSYQDVNNNNYNKSILLSMQLKENKYQFYDTYDFNLSSQI